MQKKKRIDLSTLIEVKKLLKYYQLNTVCESAQCPNIGECFHNKTATFLILGSTCTRGCKFCAVKKGSAGEPDAMEPEKVAKAVKHLRLSYAVITSVTRDDLDDGGAGHFFKTVAAVRKLSPGTKLEILVPDFNGNTSSLNVAISSKPEIFSHNIETAPSLYEAARKGADYNRSLKVLLSAFNAGLKTKSGLMLGLGESIDEVVEVLKDLRKAGTSILTVGQYLAPTRQHLPVMKHISNQEFEDIKKIAMQLGFENCISGRYVRSSYMAENMCN